MLRVSNKKILPGLLVTIFAAMATVAPVRLGSAAARTNLEAELATRIIAAERAESLPADVLEFYRKMRFQPAWTGSSTAFESANQVLMTLAVATRHGLNPVDYDVSQITRRFAMASGDPGSLSELDIQLTRSVLRYSRDLHDGRFRPVEVHPDWEIEQGNFDAVRHLLHALRSDSLEEYLFTLAPPSADYQRLLVALQQYRRIYAEGGWPSVPDGPKLESGSVDGRVLPLRKRLQISGELQEDRAEGPDQTESHSVIGDLANPADTSSALRAMTFDARLGEAVQRFQARHGLEPDGVVGRKTLEALNITAHERVAQIKATLERSRWLPRDLGAEHVLVNIPAFRLNLVRNGQSIATMRVIVGRRSRPSPVLSGTFSQMVFNPYWNVPPKLAREDIIPKLASEPDFLQTQGFRVLSDWSANATEISPDSIDWDAFQGRRFPYKLRQDPGPKNALGRVKFLFPNRHAVYLHDTPGRNLFEKSQRAFSSGCIRVENPLELARFLMAGQRHWSDDRIEQSMAAGKNQWVRLDRPVPIYVVYLTVWTDAFGNTHFVDDIYGRDQLLKEQLREPFQVASRSSSDSDY